jgi:hypothetical protein
VKLNHYCVKVILDFPKEKNLKLLVPTNIKLNDPIDYVKKLNALEESLVSPCLAFVQIRQFQGCGKYSIKGSIINVSPNVNFTQSILPCLSQDEATIGLLLKGWMEYKLPNLTSNVCPNLIMTTLHDFLNTPLYKDSNISIHSQWFDMVTLSC